MARLCSQVARRGQSNRIYALSVQGYRDVCQGGWGIDEQNVLYVEQMVAKANQSSRCMRRARTETGFTHPGAGMIFRVLHATIAEVWSRHVCENK